MDPADFACQNLPFNNIVREDQVPTKEIMQLAQEISRFSESARKQMTTIQSSPLVEDLFLQDVALVRIEEDLSDYVKLRVRQLLRKGFDKLEVIREMKAAAQPRMETSIIVENEIASVSVGLLNVSFSYDVTARLSSLSEEEFSRLQSVVPSPFPTDDRSFIEVDCRFDRMVLVINEDVFLDNTQVLLDDSNREM